MNKHRLILCLAIIFVVSCNKKNPTSVPDELEWQSLGFEDKFALRLVLAKPYLYVCAGSDGLWRRNIRQASGEWEYVGLADTSLGKYINRGVRDVLIHRENLNWLLVAFQPNLGSDHGIYRSLEGGRSWAPADSGMEFYYGEQRYYYHPSRFLQYPERILATGDDAIFLSQNFGGSWGRIYGEREPVGLEINVFLYHMRFNEFVWMGGETGYFQEFFAKSTDSGMSWQPIDLTQLVPHDNAVYSIAFDPADANIVYVGMQGAIIKTSDGGKSWVVPLVTNPQGEFFRAILSDQRDRTHLWAAGGPDFIETWDGGKTWQLVGNPIPETTKVFDMIWDEKTEAIYLGTLNGIYCFKP